MLASEELIQVGDMQFALRIWGPQDGIPVLALHGWLDNAASFDVLAPLMSRCRVAAVDLSGHGHSDHRPWNSSYLIWSDLLELLAIAEHLGWSQFNVVGHSRGGMIATLLAVAAPDKVNRLVTLDSLLPMPSDPQDTAQNLREYLRDEQRYLQRKCDDAPPRRFDSLHKAIKARQLTMPICDESALRILRRGTREVDGGYVWRHDDRLKGRSAVKLGEAHLHNMLDNLQAETLMIAARKSLLHWSHMNKLLEACPRITLHEIDGNHHFHMEEPAAEVAVSIEKFLSDGAQ